MESVESGKELSVRNFCFIEFVGFAMRKGGWYLLFAILIINLCLACVAFARAALVMGNKEPQVGSSVKTAPGRLFIVTKPGWARVRILNIRPKFYQGMELEPGSYHVEVSASGYKTKKKWVGLAAGDRKNIDIRLRKVLAAGTATSGKVFVNSRFGMKFVLVQPGIFMIESPSSNPDRSSDEARHRVTIRKPFYMQTTEVTHKQWRAIMGTNPSHFKNCGDDCPVEFVSWDDCQEFIRRLNRAERTNKYRLPTEAEWQFACQAGTETPFAFGGLLSTAQANYDGNHKGPVPVGSFPPNPWGLYDVHGNVWEWCQDWYGEYHSSHVTDPTGPSSGLFRVIRGGGWQSNAEHCGSAYRFFYPPSSRSQWLGFRLARTR